MEKLGQTALRWPAQTHTASKFLKLDSNSSSLTPGPEPYSLYHLAEWMAETGLQPRYTCSVFFLFPQWSLSFLCTCCWFWLITCCVRSMGHRRDLGLLCPVYFLSQAVFYLRILFISFPSNLSKTVLCFYYSYYSSNSSVYGPLSFLFFKGGSLFLKARKLHF